MQSDGVPTRGNEDSEMAVASNAIEPLLNEYDVARITGLSVASIRRYRLLKIGPRATKLMSSVRYKPEDLKAWLDSRPTIGGGIQQSEET
jgi:predicted DNA-binding transcriptional regulator AlpA